MKRKQKPKRRPTKRAIHRNIAALLESQDISQNELAKRCDVHKTAVSHWVNGLSQPAGPRLARVATAFGVEVSDLFAEAA